MILTLDTNVVRDVLSPTRPDHAVAMQLMECARRHRVQMQITNRLDVDVPDGPLRTQFESMTELAPMRPGAPARLGFTRIGGPDYIVSDEDAQEGDAIERLLFPGASKESARHRNRMADVDHLMGHKSSGAAAFVTNEKTMLVRARQLASAHGIKVLSPASAILQIETGELGQ